MAKLSFFGKQYRVCSKTLFFYSKLFFSLFIIYFGYSLFVEIANEDGDMRFYKKSCSKLFGTDSRLCSTRAYNFVEKTLSLVFILSGALCIPDKKKIHRHGGFFGMVGMLLYAFIVSNPLLVLYEESKPSEEEFVQFMNNELRERFLLQMAIVGVFLLIMASGFKKERRDDEELIPDSGEEGNNNRRSQGRGPSS